MTQAGRRAPRGTIEIEREIHELEQDEFDEHQRQGLVVTAAVSVIGMVLFAAWMVFSTASPPG